MAGRKTISKHTISMSTMLSQKTSRGLRELGRYAVRQRMFKSTVATSSPGEHLVTLREIDRLVTSIARESVYDHNIR